MTLTAKTLEQGLNEIEASSTPESTMKVKQMLTRLGNEKGYKVAVNGEGCTWGESEWMNDVVWAVLNEDGSIRTIPLVAECEWPKKEQDVWDDFQKLLIIRAKVRVMIFSDNADSNLVRDLKQQIECFKSSQEGDTYLFASYVHTESSPFSVEKYVFRENS